MANLQKEHIVGKTMSNRNIMLAKDTVFSSSHVKKKKTKKRTDDISGYSTGSPGML